MLENVGFSNDGLEHYFYWQGQDRRTLKKINQLILDIVRNGNEGLGHPEPLKHDLTGKWSREIDDGNRLVYKILDDNRVEIYHCRGHYNDK
jgi:toxin YoeB